VAISQTERALRPQLVDPVLAPDSVQKVDDHTVDFTTTAPYLFLADGVASLQMPIVPRGAHNDATPPVGTGAYTVRDYRPRQYAVVERFDRYWGEKAKTRRLVFRFFPDPDSRVDALRRGEVDLVLELRPEAARGLDGDERFRVVSSRAATEHILLLRPSGQGLASDPVIRQAVSLALDRQGYASSVYGARGAPAAALVPRAVLGAAADALAPPRHDPAEARRLLDEAGWRPGPDGVRARGGRPLQLTLLGGPTLSSTALRVLEAQLRGVGIGVNVKYGADRLTYDEYRLREFDLDLRPFTQIDTNAVAIPASIGYSKIDDARPFAPGPEFDSQVEQALGAPTREEAQQRSVDLIRELTEQRHLAIPLAEVPQLYAARQGVTLAEPYQSVGHVHWAGLAAA
jgi:ABC-type transport system substrate-binding protein